MRYRRILFVIAGCFIAGCAPGPHSSPTTTFETGWNAAKAGNREALTACYSEATQAGFKEIEAIRKELGYAPNIPDTLQDIIIKEARKGVHKVISETVDGDRAMLKVMINDKETEIPLHRIKIVKKKGIVIWKREF